MSKKVLIVEDLVRQRTALKNALNEWNYQVFEAGTISEARTEADLHWDELDVVVLDNDLGESIHGPDIAIEYREKKKAFPPEAIIYSSFDDVQYYRKALRLGAAAYLDKDDGLDRVVNHVKVLALCRALNPANPELVSRLARLATRSRSESEAILAFCETVLKSELESCLRVPFLVLFTQDGVTQNCASSPALPSHSPVYQELQDLAHANLSGPSTIDKNKLRPTKDQATKDLYQKLNQSVLLPLSSSDKLKLSICILTEGRDYKSPGGNEEALCKVLSQYFRPTVFANIVNIWSQWTELHATRTSTAKLCLAVGQEISSGLDDPEQLQDLANDLSDTGQYLTQLDNRNASDKLESLSICAIVQAAWEGVVRAADASQMKPPEVVQDCSVIAQKSDLELIFSRLLQWFIYRTKSMPLDVEPTIRIDCKSSDAVATITFEDNSHRLPKRLREDLFAPFTQAISTPFPRIDEVGPEPQGTKKRVRKGERSKANNHLNTGRYLPLYLAKMLVEGRYHGALEDHSDEIKEHSYGHRIMMQLPGKHDQN